MPHSHQSLNMFKSCLAKHGLKLCASYTLLTDFLAILQISQIKNEMITKGKNFFDLLSNSLTVKVTKP